MTSESLMYAIQDVFRTVFDDPSLTVRRETTADEVDGWDSFAHINLIMAVEMKFGITFRLSELQDLGCVGDMVDVVGAKLGVAA